MHGLSRHIVAKLHRWPYRRCHYCRSSAKALDWLDTAVRLHDASLVELKAEPDLDPLREEPRFQAIERELKFPA